MRLAVVERMAQEGVREMQFLLGFLKESGLGYSKNIAEAHDWYRRSAERGFAPAQYMLFYANGPEKHESGTLNEVQGKIAVDWCRKAAAGGFAPAQLSLSFETSDPKEAYSLRLAAAEQGYARAAFTLGYLYREGLPGSAPDLQTAFTWFKKAAELGDADSADGVARMLREGTGVAKDEAAALEWFLKAFEMKSQSAASALGQIYAFGMLNQPKDPAKSKFYDAKAREFRKWFWDSHGFPDKKQKTFLQKVLGIVRKASRTGSI
jgi:TPR repeat protein